MKTQLNKRYQVLAAISVLVILSFLLIVDIHYTLQDINNELRRDAKNANVYVEELITQVTSTLANLSNAPIISTGDSEKVSDFLNRINDDSKVNALVLANKDGIRWAGSKKEIKPFNVGKSEVFQGVYNTGRPYVTGAQKSILFDEIEFLIGYPIFNEHKQLEHVFYAPVYSDKFKGILSKVSLESNGNLHIIDDKGFLLLSTREDIKQLVKYPHALQSSETLNVGMLLDMDNREIMAFEKVGGTPWTIIVDTDISVVFARVAKKVLVDLIVFLLVLLPVILVFYLFLAQINRQKQELIKTNKKLQSLATTDGLTGLLNHRAFQDQLSQQLVYADNSNPLTLLMMDIDNFKIFNDTYGHQTGDRVLRHLSNILTTYFSTTGIVARYGGEEFAVILSGVDYEEGLSIAKLLSKLIRSTNFNVNKNEEAKIGISIGIASYPKNASDRENLIRFADQALYKAKEQVSNKVQMYYSALEELRDSIEDHDVLKIVYTLNTIINAKDKYTFSHSERVMNYAVRIAQHLGLPREDINNITIGALLHDIGKIEVTGDILNKPDRLSFDEFEHIKNHPNIGAEIIKPLNSLERALPFVLYHHERYDGKGYPYGLKGISIPLYGRIAAVADSFDAMTTRRPYQKAKSHAEAIEELNRNAGKQFDPEIVAAFIELICKNNDHKAM